LTSVINEIHQMHTKKRYMYNLIAPPLKEEGLEYPYILSEPARKGLTCKAIMLYINFVRNYFLVVEYEKEVIEMVKRKYYLDKLIKAKDKQLIKVISGVRRSGNRLYLCSLENF